MTLTVTEAISSRRATRQFTDQAIPAEVLDRVVQNALEAPSAFNAQMRDPVSYTHLTLPTSDLV